MVDMKQTLWKRIHQNNKAIKYKYWDTYICISCIFYVLYRPLEHITYVAYVCFNFLSLFLKFSTINTFFVLKINTKSPINDNVHYDWLIGVTSRADRLQYIFPTVSRKYQNIDYVVIYFLWAHYLSRHWNPVGFICGFLKHTGKKPQSL